MKILPAEERHVDDVARMMEDFFACHAGLQPDFYRPVRDCARYPRAALQREDGAFYVAEEGEAAVGFLNIVEDITPPLETFIPYRHATVMDLYVAPGHRRKGVATALLAAAEAWAGERGLAYLELNVVEGNTRALGFYESGGFFTAGRTMRRKLQR